MIGLVASNHQRGRRIVEELGLKQADVLIIGSRQVNTLGRGHSLTALLIDDTAANADLTALTPCLARTGGQTYMLVRK